jgi:hypothetical protein
MIHHDECGIKARALSDASCTSLSMFCVKSLSLCCFRQLDAVKYCTVLAVLVRFTDYTAQSFTIFYCRLYSSVLQSFFTVDSDPLMSCVGAVCWCLPSSKAGHELCCLLAWLFFDSSYSLTICDWLFSSTAYSTLLLFLPYWLFRNLTASSTLTLAESESYVTTDGQSASLSWNKAPIWSVRPDFYYRRTVAGLLMWGALSDERTGLSFTIAAGPSQRSHSLVRAPLDSRPYFTVSDLRLPISSPPTTRWITVEVFDPATTRVSPPFWLYLPKSLP